MQLKVQSFFFIHHGNILPLIWLNLDFFRAETLPLHFEIWNHFGFPFIFNKKK